MECIVGSSCTNDRNAERARLTVLVTVILVAFGQASAFDDVASAFDAAADRGDKIGSRTRSKLLVGVVQLVHEWLRLVFTSRIIATTGAIDQLPRLIAHSTVLSKLASTRLASVECKRSMQERKQLWYPVKVALQSGMRPLGERYRASRCCCFFPAEAGAGVHCSRVPSGGRRCPGTYVGPYGN